MIVGASRTIKEAETKESLIAFLNDYLYPGRIAEVPATLTLADDTIFRAITFSDVEVRYGTVLTIEADGIFVIKELNDF